VLSDLLEADVVGSTVIGTEIDGSEVDGAEAGISTEVDGSEVDGAEAGIGTEVDGAEADGAVVGGTVVGVDGAEVVGEAVVGAEVTIVQFSTAVPGWKIDMLGHGVSAKTSFPNSKTPFGISIDKILVCLNAALPIFTNSLLASNETS